MRLARLLAVLAASLPVAPRASTAESLDLAALVRASQVVVHGRVLRATSAWEGGVIVTRTAVEVHRALKGSADREVVVRTLGGAVGGIGQRAHGEVELLPGEEVVLFLEAAGGDLVPAGLAQGAVHVSADAAGVRWAAPGLAGLGLARRGAGERETAAAAVPERLDAFLARVERLVGAGRPR
jgi:hypothetical protein